MKLHSFLAFLGGLLGFVATFQIGWATKVTWLSLGIILGLSILGYLLVTIVASRVPKFAEVIRGFLIGSNSALNVCFILVILNSFSPPIDLLSGKTGNLVINFCIGMALGLFTFVSVFKWVSQLRVYQTMMGWVNWLLPMSWPIVVLGFLFLLFSLLLSCLTGFQVKYLRLQKGKVDWATGTFFIKGGLVANLNAWDTAFNMGNFSFVDMNSRNFHVKHEAGHTLNLAAFGFLFHLIGFLEEFVFQRGAKAYSERIAESHDTGRQSGNIPMWA